jgi:hypothetical protein
MNEYLNGLGVNNLMLMASLALIAWIVAVH